MNRKEKINAIVEFLEENSLIIIDTVTIQGLIIDADFLEKSNLMIVKGDDISGVSFDNVELSLDLLVESKLWEDEKEEQ